MANTRETKESSPTSGAGFFKDQQQATAVCDVTQLFDRSCTALCCAQLFALILLEANPNLKVSDLIKIVRIFEIGIYADIWKKPYDEADEQKSIEYINTYLSTPPSIITDPKTIESLSPKDNSYLIMVIINNEGMPHTLFVTENGKQFSFANIEHDNLTSISSTIQRVIRINKKDINSELINSHYLKYKNSMTKSLSSYDENDVLKKYYVHSLQEWGNALYHYKSPLLNLFFSDINDSFPECRFIIEKQLFEFPENFVSTLFEMDKLIEQFPPCRESIKKQFLKNPATYFNTFNDIQCALQLFPECKPQIQSIFLMDIEKHLQTLFHMQLAITAFPDCQQKMADLFLSKPERYLTDWFEIETALEIFQQYKDNIHQLVLKDTQRFLQSEEEIQKEKRLFNVIPAKAGIYR